MGLICFAGGDTSKQGESRGIKGNQEESGEIKRSQGDQCEPRKNEMK